MIKRLIFMSVFFISVGAVASPKYTDYCAMLARDIEGKQYSFIAGNKLYYIGGKVDEYWRPVRHETIGLMHPMFRDGRARGFGITEGTGGVGHDKFGWEFWNYTKGAIGTVIIDGKRYVNPKPTSMIWRPDRVICSYEVGGVHIVEEKFITDEDVLCDRITADKPIEIYFEGHSFVNPDAFPTFDGDAPGQTFSQSQTATGAIRGNFIHVVEGGTTLVKPDWKEVAVGKIMYDGLSVVISSSEKLKDPRINPDAQGRQAYTFTVPVSPEKPTTITYAVGDKFSTVKRGMQQALKNVEKVRDTKTRYINDLLNQQIPYFRCSDELVVKTYYYLWSLYFMYFTDLDNGYESYPHTQTAINNFMGLHLWDSWAYTAMGSWVVDKWSYGYGNVLSWKHMLPFKGPSNSLPDNFGTTWYSPGVGMNLVGSVEFGWDMYRKSGDKQFLDVLYNELFRPLYWDQNGPQPSMGEEVNAIHFLRKMANELGQTDDDAHWQSMHGRLYENWSRAWEGHAPDFYASKGAPWKDIWNLAALLNYEMPQDWADRMTDRWIMNTEEGFLGPVSFLIRPPTEPENGVFAVSSISTWLAVEGLFRHGRGGDGLIAALSHLNGMTRDHGFPVAPECWEPENFAPWGSLYYNWDGAIVDLILRRIVGADFSLQDGVFTFHEHLPESWEWMEASIPVVHDDKINWVRLRADQDMKKEGLYKTVSVENSPLDEVRISAWTNGRAVIGTNKAYAVSSNDHSAVSVILGKKNTPSKTYASVRPYQREFIEPLRITIDNIEVGTTLRYSLDGSIPQSDSPIAPSEMNITESCQLTLRAWNRFGEAREPFVVAFKKATLEPAHYEKNLVAGLHYKLFEGSFSRLPDFQKLVSIKEGVTPILNPVEIAGKDEEFALSYRGLINVPETGFYTFYLTSDDGSRLNIAGKTIAELNVRSDLDPWMAEGDIALEAGFHPIEIEYFQFKKRNRLELKYKINGGELQSVSSKMLYHASE